MLNAFESSSMNTKVILFFFLMSQCLSQIAQITITDSSITLFNEYLIFEKNSMNKTYDISTKNYQGKLCIGNNHYTILQCIETFEYYSRQWIILVDLIDFLDILPDFINKDKYRQIEAVIANNETINRSELTTDVFNYPLFWCNKTNFEKIASYNIYNEKENYYTSLKYLGEYSALLHQVSFYLIIALFVLSVIVAFYWYYILKKYSRYMPDNSGTIQSFLWYMSYLKVFMLFFCIYHYYYHYAMDNIVIEGSYLDPFILLLNSVNISIFWFFLLLIANGWFVFKESFNRNQFFGLVIGYIAFYILFCIDKMIDFVVKTSIISNLTISDLKNLLMYTILLELCRRFSYETIHVLKVKYTYAYYYSAEFIFPLKHKIIIVRYHLLICIINWFLIIIQIALLKPILKEEKLLQLIWFYVEIIVFISVLILYKPMKYTRYYFIDNGDDFEQFLPIRSHNVYVCNYQHKTKNNYNDIVSIKDFTKHEINNIKEQENYPIIVLQPFNNNRLSIGFLMK